MTLMTNMIIPDAVATVAAIIRDFPRRTRMGICANTKSPPLNSDPPGGICSPGVSADCITSPGPAFHCRP